MARTKRNKQAADVPAEGAEGAEGEKAPTEAPEPAAKKAKAEELKIGDQFPNLGSLETDESTPEAEVRINLEDVLQENGIVIFSYPKANTGGCTRQACGFRDNTEELEAAGYKVFGISADKPKSQANWKAKYKLTYTLLTSDAERTALKKLGFARGDKGINRSHIVVGKGGKVLDIRIGISPADSFGEAVKTVAAASN